MTDSAVAIQGRAKFFNDSSIPMYGEFSDTSIHPFFGLEMLGGQWPEARSFARQANLGMLARLASVLCGLQAFIERGSPDGNPFLVDLKDYEYKAARSRSVARVVSCVVELCPKLISKDPVETSVHSYKYTYIADQRFVSLLKSTIRYAGVEGLLSEEDVNDEIPPIEADKELHAFTHMANPYAMSILGETLCSMQSFLLQGGDAADSVIGSPLSLDRANIYMPSVARTLGVMLAICPDMTATENKSDNPYIPGGADPRLGDIIGLTYRYAATLNRQMKRWES